MRSEHRAPLVASVIVVLACAGVLTHAIRTDALGGFASRPFHVIAGHLVVPADKAVADPAPLVPATPSATPSAAPTSARPSAPSKAVRHPVRATHAPNPAPAHPVAPAHPATPAVPSVPVTTQPPAVPVVGLPGSDGTTSSHHGFHGFHPHGWGHPSTDDPVGHFVGQLVEQVAGALTSHGYHGSGPGLDHGWGRSSDHSSDHGSDHGRGHGWGHGSDGHRGWHH